MSRVVLEVGNNAREPAKHKPGSYDWGDIMQRRLCQIFPDLKIDRGASKGKQVILFVKSANGPMHEEDIRSRIHDFMMLYPMMHVETLTIKAEAA